MQDQPLGELLDIREAAALLRVSEISLRRWTNAGRLRCVRIGGRRERRFRRADLLAFLGIDERAVSASPRSQTHFCAFYTSDFSRARQAAQFLASGLQLRSYCILVAAQPVQRAVLELLARDHPDVQNEVAAGRVRFADYLDSTTAQLQQLESTFRAALSYGVTRIVAVGDVTAGALGALPFEELIEYEVEYGRSIARRFPVLTLCQYDARRLSGVDAAHVLECHDSSLQ